MLCRLPFPIRLGLLFCLTISALFYCKQKNESFLEGSQNEEKYPAIIFLGDSLTAGYGLPAQAAPPNRIAVKIKAAGRPYRVINAGRSGDTTAGGLARLNWYLQPRLNPKHLVIGLGSNDAMRGMDPGTIEKNLRSIIKKTRDFDANIKIYLWQMHTFANLGPNYTKKYTRIFPRVARLEKIMLLPFPLKGVATKPKLNQADGIHPNEEGAEIIAENIWKSLKGHL